MYIRKAILGAASAIALASPAAASDLSVAPYTSGPPMNVKLTLTSIEPRPVSLSRSRLRSLPRQLSFGGRSESRRPEWWWKNILSMQRHECMPHLPCMRTRVRVGVTDGAIGTFMADGRVL